MFLGLFCCFFFCVFFFFLQRGVLLFLFSALSQLWWGLFLVFFRLSADFWVTKLFSSRPSFHANLPEVTFAHVPVENGKRGWKRTWHFPSVSVQSGEHDPLSSLKTEKSLFKTTKAAFAGSSICAHLSIDFIGCWMSASSQPEAPPEMV